MKSAHHPLVLVDDEVLLDHLLKLAAAAGCELERVPDATAARRRWATAPMVVLDAEGARQCAAAALPVRAGVTVLAPDPVPEELWREAMLAGAERVLSLPGADPWLVSALADAAEGAPSRSGKVLAVTGARGGAGASVFVVATGLTALGKGQDALLVDCDPRGGGLDVVLGAESEEGMRWPDMSLKSGRIAASKLHEALPNRRRGPARLTVLSGARKGLGPAPEAVAAVVEAGRRSGEVVICDIPRDFDAAAHAALDRADLTALVVPGEIRACAAAKFLVAQLGERGITPRLIVRGPYPGGLKPEHVEEAVGVPLLAAMNEEPNLARSLERGKWHPRRRGPLATAARTTLTALAATPPKPLPGEDDLRTAS